MIKIIGIKIIDRIKEAGLTQGILSRHASVITTRLGFHEVTDSVCSREAYIVLHLKDGSSESMRLTEDLRNLGGVEIKELSFDPGAKGNSEPDDSALTEILCILIEQDTSVIASVQKILTSYGCNIRTRLGVNETFFGQPAGLIILELSGEKQQRQLLEKDLGALNKVHVRPISF